MGRRKRERQQELWVATASLPDVPRHVFYEKLNRLLDETISTRSWRTCASRTMRPTRGGLDSAGPLLSDVVRGIFRGYRQPAGHCLAVCGQSVVAIVFLFLESHESSPDHSSLSRIQRSPAARRCTSRCFALCSGWLKSTSCFRTRRWPSIRPTWKPTRR